MYVDAHVHLVEFDEKYIENLKEFDYLLAVSTDFNESIRTIELSKKFSNVYPGIGLHPWEVEKNKVEEIIELRKNIKKKFFFGEIGLDKLFHPETFETQLKVFERFLEVASGDGIPINVHSAGAWKEALEIVKKFEIEKAIFHWFTGPDDVLNEIIDLGYFITVNPAIKVQKRQLRILEKTPIENLLTESDGPYKYRDLFMEPKRIPEVLKMITEIKGMEIKDVANTILKNVRKYLK